MASQRLEVDARAETTQTSFRTLRFLSGIGLSRNRASLSLCDLIQLISPFLDMVCSLFGLGMYLDASAITDRRLPAWAEQIVIAEELVMIVPLVNLGH